MVRQPASGSDIWVFALQIFLSSGRNPKIQVLDLWWAEQRGGGGFSKGCVFPTYHYATNTSFAGVQC